MLFTYNEYHLKEVYEGDFKDDKMEGQGKILFKDGSTYEGEMVNDNCEGYGVMAWDDGKKYEGCFKNNFKHGKGEYTTIIGDQLKSFTAVFENGVVKEWINEWERKQESWEGVLFFISK